MSTATPLLPLWALGGLYLIRNCYLNHSGEDVVDGFFAVLVIAFSRFVKP
jgi:hypothetical protein